MLVSGRWFRSASLAGPWAFVEGKELPADFARIPDASPKENAKASVPGTPQAEEALVANQIPQMARVDRQKTSFVPRFEGDPVLRPVEGTVLSYVANSPTPIIEVTPTQWYALDNGVWFTAPALVGPWSVATSVPTPIYTIPTSSPLHYVTYVRIYDVQPTYVLVGYTPGYLGTVVAPGPVVVYGTGYWYPSYVGPDVWYGWPYTYGFGLGLAWTPWTSWGFGFGFGWGWGAVSVGWGGGWGWGCAPWWGPYPWAHYPAPPYAGYAGHGTVPAPARTAAAWGPGSWAATRSNVYQHWTTPGVTTRSSATYNPAIGNSWSGAFGHAYNSRTGAIAAGQRGNLVNVYRGTWSYGGPSRGAWGGGTWGSGAGAWRGGAWGGRQPNPYYGGGARAAAPNAWYPGGAYRGAPAAGGSFHGAPAAGRTAPAPAAGGGGARGGAPSGGGGHHR